MGMSRPRLLDLYCGQGGASMGYYLAGFDVIGVDLKPQKQYPFPICRRESLSVLTDVKLLAEFDAIHASPPCQSESALRHVTGRAYDDLITPTMNALHKVELPWVVENVASTQKLPGSVVLCGTHFNLGTGDRVLRRHRRFKANFPLPQPGPCTCLNASVGGVYGTLSGGASTRGFKFNPDESRTAMGIDWMSRRGLSLAIPPAYTRWVAEHLARRFFPGLSTRDHLRSRYCSGRIEQFARL
jgi:DNA (cytosine-5)-methyltransferase 1